MNLTEACKILGIDTNTDFDTAKKRYKKLALECHPDKQPNRDDTDFKELNSAWEAWTKKDDIRSSARSNLNNMMNNLNNRNNQNNNNLNNPSFGNNLNNIFKDFVQRGFDNLVPRRGENIYREINISLNSLVMDNVYDVKYPQKVKCGCTDTKIICRSCMGTGNSSVRDVLRGESSIPMNVSTCIECLGKGYKSGCMLRCDEGLIVKQKIKMINIPKFFDIEKPIVFIGHGDQVINNGTPGDLIVKIKLNDESREEYQFKKGDVYHDIHISLKESLIGFKKDYLTFMGSKLSLNSNNKILKNDDGFKFPNKGFLIHGQETIKKRGSFFVVIKINYPNVLSENVRKQLDEIL